ncbi:MAG: CHASE2 domain-containing protein [Bacteroidales bacterium]|nr:CHASE2 domain-containing protein [Bacteroidales bacterium]
MKRFLLALGITVVAVPLMWVLVLNPFEHEADFALSDFYTRTAQRMHPVRLDSNIVVIGVDSLSRLEIAQAAEMADFLGAAAVGLDVFMNGSTPDDAEVLAALASCDHLVLPSSLTEKLPDSIFPALADTPCGYVNLESSVDGGIVRSYGTERNGFQGFAAAVCGQSGPGGIIRYDGVDFDVLKPDEMSEAGIEGRFVFIGNINDFSDCHPTPVGTMPGVMIHAYTARTILDGCTPKPLSKALQFAIAFVIVFLLIWLHSCVSAKISDLANFTIRIGQLILLLVLYIVGAGQFANHGIYADFSLTLLLVASAMVVYDLVYGIIALVRKKRNVR